MSNCKHDVRYMKWAPPTDPIRVEVCDLCGKVMNTFKVEVTL